MYKIRTPINRAQYTYIYTSQIPDAEAVRNEFASMNVGWQRSNFQ